MMFNRAAAFATLIAFSFLSTAQADLFVTRPGYGTAPGAVLRFNETTGASITAAHQSSTGRYAENMEAGVFGPDGQYYAIVNTMGLGEVWRFDADSGAFLNVFVSEGSGGLTIPFALRFGPDGSLYVASRAWQAGGGKILRYDGRTGAFQNVFVAPGSGGLENPSDLIFAPNGDLYVSDGVFAAGGGKGILRYQAATGAFAGIVAPKGAGGLDQAAGMAFGPDGNLYVSSAATHSILRFDINSGAFLDAFVSAGDGGLNTPRGLAFGPDGRLYVCSAGNNSVLRFDGGVGDYIDTFVASGAGGLSSGPSSLAFSPRVPKLQISHVTGNIILKWQCGLGDFAVQTCESPAKGWTAINTAPVVNGNEMTVTTPAQGAGFFFRLKKQ